MFKLQVVLFFSAVFVFSAISGAPVENNAPKVKAACSKVCGHGEKCETTCQNTWGELWGCHDECKPIVEQLSNKAVNADCQKDSDCGVDERCVQQCYPQYWNYCDNVCRQKVQIEAIVKKAQK